jgi:hypothetical protein
LALQNQTRHRETALAHHDGRGGRALRDTGHKALCPVLDIRCVCNYRNSKPVDHSNLTTKHVSAPAQCHARHLQHPQTPPKAAGLNRVRTGIRPLQQAPSRQGWQVSQPQRSTNERTCDGVYSPSTGTSATRLSFLSLRDSGLALPRGASSQPREREARTDTPTHPPSPRQTAPQPRASPGGGRPAAIPHRLGRTRAGSKLSAGPPRGAAQHRQPQKGAERACDASTVKIRLHFVAWDSANASQPEGCKSLTRRPSLPAA